MNKIGNDNIFIKYNPKINQHNIKELEEILSLYIKNYSNIGSEKIEFFNKENEVRTNYERDEEYKLDEIFLGYLINKNDEMELDTNLVKFMVLRFNGLQNCLCNQELYLENNKHIDTCNEQKYLEFYKKELKKLEDFNTEYIKNKLIIDNNKEKKIEFVKKICEKINWGFEEDNSSCEIFNNEKKKDLHSKTFIPNKQLVLGGRDDTDWLSYLKCNRKFYGWNITTSNNRANYYNNLFNICDKTVEWNLLLNKYAKLSIYYTKAPFIRFLLIEGKIMPYRRYPSIIKKGKKIGTLQVYKYKFDIYDNIHGIPNIYFSKYYNFIFYNETNHIITPPLLRSAITTTYMEFRDLLCYLNLPVFRSTINRNMLFFPNYDLHQRLLEIQGLCPNYSTYDGKSIDWKWFKEGKVSDDVIEAQQKIEIFCNEFKENEGCSIEFVEYVWADVKYPNSIYTKKFIFLVCRKEELVHYKECDIFKHNKKNKYYVCNKNEVPNHMIKTVENFFDIKKIISSLKQKYVKYKIKYLNLKKLLQKNEK
jgi:hypothetical protein